MEIFNYGMDATERLTERMEKYAAAYHALPYHREIDGTVELLQEAAEKLKEYEDLEEQGLLLKLPCKAGDTVYTLNLLPDGETTIAQLETDTFFMVLCVMDGRFGKTVFLTQAEAKEALKRMEGENDRE